MRASEFLRALIAVVDSIKEKERQITVPTQQPVVVVNNIPQAPAEAETTPSMTQSSDNVGQFVPPLQSKIELMKKATAVDSVYNPGDPNGENVQPDEVETLRKNAGIHPLLKQLEAADDDGPFEG